MTAMTIFERFFHLAAVLALVPVCGCPNGDGGGVLSTTAETESASGTETFGNNDGGDTVDETADETGAPPSDPCHPDPGAFASFPVAIDSVAFDATTVCAGLPLPHFEIPPPDPVPSVQVYIYRPDDAGDWPNEPPRPTMFFVPGAGQFTVDTNNPSIELYDHVFDDVIAEGIPVFAAQPLEANDSSLEREALLVCVMTWAKTPPAEDGWSRSEDGLIGDGAIIAGHSRGGAATNLLVNDFDDFVAMLPPMASYELCGAAQIAPRWGGDTALDGATNVQTPLENTVPLFVIHGALDEDLIGQGLASFDAMGAEDLAMALDPGEIDPTSLTPFDKLLLWVYGVRHNDFGGRGDVPPGPEVDRANATGPTYLAAFLRWQLFGDASARSELLAAVDAGSATTDFPAPVQPAMLWDAIEPQFSDHGRPLVVGNFTQGIGAVGADRIVIDTLARGSTTETCADDPGPAFPSDSTLGLETSVDGLVDDMLCQGPATMLGDDLGVAARRHQTEALLVGWGDTAPGGSVTWSLQQDGEPAIDVTGFKHLSLRVANLAQVPTAIMCDVADSTSFDFLVELESETPDGLTATVGYDPGPAIQQMAAIVEGPAITACAGAQAMRTIRIPLTEFCGQGQVDLARLSAIRLVFPTSPTEHWALLDSIEFTRDPDAIGTSPCPSATASFDCIADSLVAIEVSCADEPIDGTCPPSSIETNLVPLPWVDNGSGGGHVGWVIQSPPGWVADPENPTISELSDLTEACVSACALEWSDNPDIIATCDAPSAFLPPTLRESSDVGAVQRIPASQEGGSGRFQGQQLACNLEDDCCLAFDEDLCAAKPRRFTTAQSQLRRGEEQRVELGGPLTRATFSTPGATESMPMVGSAGYSICSAGEPGPTCPLYVGSFELSGTSPVTLDDTCPDGSALSLTVSDLDLELLQPAMGIADQGSDAAAFPAGALHLRGFVVVDGVSRTIRAVNEAPVLIDAKYPSVFAGDMTVGFSLPCGGGTVPVEVAFRFKGVDDLASRPWIAITTPAAVQCPKTVSLSTASGDPDDDLASVRWYVDDVLMSPSTTAVPFTTGHTLRAVARDSRGATRTATRTVACR